MKQFSVEVKVDLDTERGFTAEMMRHGNVKLTMSNREQGLTVHQVFWLNRDEAVSLRDTLTAHIKAIE